MTNVDLSMFLDPSKQQKVLEEAQEAMKKETKGGFGDPRILTAKMGTKGETNLITGFFLPNIYPFELDDGTIARKHHVEIYEHWFNEGTERVRSFCKKRMHLFLAKDWNEPCPICDYVNNNWPYINSGVPGANSERDARKAKRKVYTNFYVISDSYYPDNNGKVMILEVPSDVFKHYEIKINGVVDSKGNKIEDEENLYAFPRVRKMKIIVEKNENNPKWRSFKKSGFGDKEDFMGGDMKKIEAILKQCHNLTEMFNKAYEGVDTNALSVLINNIKGNIPNNNLPEVNISRNEVREANTPSRPKPVETGVEDDVIDDIPDFNVDEFDVDNYTK